MSEDRVHRQRLLAHVPEHEYQYQRYRENRRRRRERNAEVVDQVVRYQGSDHADEDHHQPVDPRHVAARTELDPQGDQQQRSHHVGRDHGAEFERDREKVACSFADRRRQNL